ncbi:hypothetical protein JL721_2794 [Aureococcus anophagefferens]|nr:hypothetical protein JL721_2794 [Aureococcus anophagefferens]
MASASSDPAPPASGASADADASGAGSSFLVVGGLGVAALHAVALPFLLPALRKHCLPYVAANAEQMELLTAAARRRNLRRVVDLGSGDGVVCVELSRRLGIVTVGHELNPWLVWYSRLRARAAGVHHLCTFHRGDMFDADLTGADGVALFVVPAMMADLEAKFARDLDVDAVVLAARFPLATWAEFDHDEHAVRSRGYRQPALDLRRDPAARAAGQGAQFYVGGFGGGSTPSAAPAALEPARPVRVEERVGRRVAAPLVGDPVLLQDALEGEAAALEDAPPAEVLRRQQAVHAAVARGEERVDGRVQGQVRGHRRVLAARRVGRVEPVEGDADDEVPEPVPQEPQRADDAGRAADDVADRQRLARRGRAHAPGPARRRTRRRRRGRARGRSARRRRRQRERRAPGRRAADADGDAPPGPSRAAATAAAPSAGAAGSDAAAASSSSTRRGCVRVGGGGGASPASSFLRRSMDPPCTRRTPTVRIVATKTLQPAAMPMSCGCGSDVKTCVGRRSSPMSPQSDLPK